VLADALLVRAGALGPEGGSEDGNSTCDYLPIEKRLHHSLIAMTGSDQPITLIRGSKKVK
jgi:hypothetical protein